MEKREETLKFEELKASLRRGDPRILVGIDIAKDAHVARVEHSDGRVLVEKMGIENSRQGFEAFRERIEGLRRQLGLEVVLAFEPSGGYQKLLGDYLIQSGHLVVQVSGVVANRNRQTLGDAWLKTDPQDARNLVDLLRQGKILRYATGAGFMEEAKRLVQCDRMLMYESNRLKVRIRNRLLPVAFPELDVFFPKDASHPDLLAILRHCPSAKEIASLPEEEFIRLVSKGGRLGRRKERFRRIYQKAKESIGVEVQDGFRWEAKWIADRLQTVIEERKELKAEIARILSPYLGYRLVQTIPGVGKLLGAIFVVEIGDPWGYRHWRQVMKLSGLNLAIVQSGKFQGTPRISKQGKGLLRWAAYQAAVVATTKDPLFHQIYQKALENRATQKGAKKRALVKVAAKILKIAFAILRDQIKYAPELASPGHGL
jgi:transposase